MRFTFALTVVVVVVATSVVKGWGDEGHLLIASIGRKLMKEDSVKRLEDILAAGSDVIFGSKDLARLDHIAVWPDHIKCKHDTPWCRGESRLQGITVFDDFHYTNIPLHMGAEAVGSTPSVGTWRTNAVSVLHDANRTLEDFGEKQSAGMIVHVFGDLHQPLHCCELHCPAFPNGDRGGNDIKIVIDKGASKHEGIGELHALWDLGGGGLKQSWPSFDESLDDLAQELMNNHSEIVSSPEARNVNFTSIALEGLDLCGKVVYNELTASTLNEAMPFHPSQHYLEQTAQVSLERIVLGGARLATLLDSLADNAPNIQDLLPSKKKQSSLLVQVLEE